MKTLKEIIEDDKAIKITLPYPKYYASTWDAPPSKRGSNFTPKKKKRKK